MNRKFGIVIYEKAQPIDIIGPWEVFSFWKNVLHGPIDLYLIAEKEGLVELDCGITLKAHADFASSPPLDYLLVPGGVGRQTQVHNEKLLSYIQKQAARCQYVLSVCTGMFLLAKAGLLKDKTVSTYWRALPELKQIPDIAAQEERIVKSGKIWTSGGVTSGIDLALAFIAEIGGQETAGQVQLLLEYFPEQTIYCTDKTAGSLPPYQGTHAPLPAYIRKLLSR